MAAAGPSRGPDLWKPSRYLEPNHPDNEEVQEQAAYQAAVSRLSNDSRAKRYKPRRTVDYSGGVLKWRQTVKLRGLNYLPPIHPSPSDIVGLLSPEAHRLNSSTSVCDHFVHTSINKERSPTRVVKWTPDARRLLTGNDKGQFTLWNGSSFNYESITQVHDDSIRALAYSHNGQSLVSVDKLGGIKYFTPQLTNIHGFQGHREACHGIDWSPNDERFVTGGDDGLVKIWNYREAKEERALNGHGWDVRCVSWHPSKGLVVSGSKDMLVKFWDPRTGRDLSTLHSHKAVINSCNWSPNGHYVATAGGDGLIRLFDIRTFRELDVMKGHGKEIHCLEWHPIHHDLLVSGDSAGVIMYWSLLAPNPADPITTMQAAHEDSVFSLAFHPLGHLLCSGSKDFTTRFWCRARPQGGQESDRWHVGEEKALGLKMEGERANSKSKWNFEAKEEEKAPPGLPGLGNGHREDRSTSPNFGAKPGDGPSSLPGFGAPRNVSGSAPQGPPARSWVPDPMAAPLPSSGAMPPFNDPRGPRGYGPPPASNRYGPPQNAYGPGSGGYGGRGGGPGRQDPGSGGGGPGVYNRGPDQGQRPPPPASGPYGHGPPPGHGQGPGQRYGNHGPDQVYGGGGAGGRGWR